MSGVQDGAGLQGMFAEASGCVAELGRRQPSLRKLVPTIAVVTDPIELLLNPDALGSGSGL